MRCGTANGGSRRITRTVANPITPLVFSAEPFGAGARVKNEDQGKIKGAEVTAIEVLGGRFSIASLIAYILATARLFLPLIVG